HLADKAQRDFTALGPQPLEGIQQISMILARLDGADHQVQRTVTAHVPHFLAYHGTRISLIKVAAQVEEIEPALFGDIPAQTPLHFTAHLLADGLRNRDETVCR